ncbi:MAG: hypothetical protein ACXWUN_10505, partial [Allosphingosinicella sp.]
LSPELTRDNDTVSVTVGGRAEVFRQVGETIQEDLARAESIALPITLILLVQGWLGAALVHGMDHMNF